jgi:hypothetical protein
MATKKKREEIIKSEFGRLSKDDGYKALFMAVISGALGALLEVLSSGWSLDKETLNYVLIGAITGGLGYVTKNFGTNSEDKLFKLEKKRLLKHKRILNKKK